jgi:hypothetical protein
MLLTVQMDTEKAGQAIANGKLPEIMESAFDRLKPEAAYFGAQDGVRTGYFVFDLKQTSDIPSMAEPFFQELGAKLTITPVMDLSDVQSGLGKYASG